MFIKLSPLLFLLVELLSLYNLSSINDNHTQEQLQITNKLVNQLSLSTIPSTVSTDMKWIKALKNLTENGGQKIVLECQVNSLYPVKFNWYRYNNPIDRNRFIITENSFRSSIRLKNLKESILGFYTCEASNDYQTLTSTGFVRAKNPNFNPIDFNDDLLPSIEFQPEIISTNDQINDQVKCEIYKGNICRLYLASKYISITSNEIEQNLIDNMKILSKKCQEFLLPMICSFIYPICNDNQKNIRSICRKSCYFYQNNSCMKELSNSYNIPTCENLPPSSDDLSCLKINQHRINKTKSSSLQHFNSFSIGFLIICLSIIIIFLLILFSYCYWNRITQKQLSLSRKKSSHFLLSQKIASSNSSSTNTNLTNINHRQICLETDSKYIPLIGHSLSDIPFTNIRFLQEIGQGEFGRIYIGELVDSTTKCIIKTLENEKLKQDFSGEIEIFRHIRHVNISNLIGICFQSNNIFSLTINEYLNHGDLHECLVQQRLKPIDLFDFFYISIQIVSGMIYLSEKNFLHNDLSTRNIFISEYLDIKITNIARYRQKYHFNYYKLTNHLLPVRWMSIESLLSGIYSEMSDIWSFGVLLWEIFSYGKQPYHGQTNPEVIEMIRDRKLLTCPINCPKKIYILMCSCWEEISDQRPTFIELMTKLKQLEEQQSLINEEFIPINQIESPKTKYRTLVSPNGQLVTQQVVV